MNVDNAANFNNYLGRLEKAANTNIGSFDDYLTALKKRHDFFAGMNCSVSGSWTGRDLCRRIYRS